MTSTHKWNYEVAIPAFKQVTKDPISEKYSPYGLPYYAIIAAMMTKGKANINTKNYEFEIKNGKLEKILGPSVYAGSKMFLNAQPRPVFRPWNEYVSSVIEIMDADYPTAAPDYRQLSDKITTLYEKYAAAAGALSGEAIQAVEPKAGKFVAAGDESFYYEEVSGYHLELRQEGGGTEIDVGMDLKTGKLNTTLMTRASLTKKTDYDRFVKFVTTRKTDLEKYVQGLIPHLKASPQAQNEAVFKADTDAIEKDITAFYDKHCKPSIEALRNANQLQGVI